VRDAPPSGSVRPPDRSQSSLSLPSVPLSRIRPVRAETIRFVGSPVRDLDPPRWISGC
jgi:hypothetical protein